METKSSKNQHDTSETKKSEKGLISFCHKVTSDTPIHGFAYLTGEHKSTTVNLWLITIAVSIVAVVLMYFKIRQSNPVISEIANIDMYAPSLPFAAVTVCDVDLRAKYFRNQQSTNGSFDLQSYLRRLFHFKDSHELLKHYKRLDHRNLIRFKNAGEDADPKVLTDLTEQNTTVSGHLTFEYLLSLSRSCEDMITVCMWQGKPCKKKDFPRMVPTSFGFCCSFNYLGNYIEIDNGTKEYIDKIRPASLQEEQSIIADLNKSSEGRLIAHIESWRRTSQHRINVTYKERNRSMKPLEARGIGYGNGLTLLLKGKKAKDRLHGFQLLVHSSLDSPVLFPPGLPMSLGTEVTSLLRVNQVSQAEQIRYYEPKSPTDCRTFDEDGTPYSMRNCISECVAKSAEESCLCRPSFYLKGETNYCNLFGMSCFWKNHGRILEVMKNNTQGRFEKGSSACRCNPQCEGQQYKTTTQESPLFTNFDLIHRHYSDVVKEFMGEEEEHSREEERRRQQYLRGNFSIVNVYFQERATMDFHSRPLYTANNFLPQMGGTMSLMMGFSLICVLCIASISFNWLFPSHRTQPN